MPQTTSHDDDEVEEFYEELNSIIDKVPKKDILIVLGDWNAKVGADAYQDWAGTGGNLTLMKPMTEVSGSLSLLEVTI